MAHNKRDILCKSTVEDHTADMLHFFYPNAGMIFDFNKGFEWLNIELADLNPGREDIKHPKVADRVLKAYTLSGEVIFIIIGVEFQGYYDQHFHERMFTYYYRLFDKYGKRVTLLAIYTDRAADRAATVFSTSLFNTDLHFSFMPYRVWEQDEEALKRNINPYAFVILTIMLGRTGRQKQRLTAGISLAKKILSRPFDNHVKISLLKFLRLYIDFENTDIRAQFDHALDTLTHKLKPMGIIELEKTWAKEEGLEQGLEQGIELGMERGNKNARISNARNMLLLGFDADLIHKITELPVDEIRELAL